MNNPIVRARLLIDGKAIESEHLIHYEIKFYQSPILSTVPVLLYKGKQVRKHWALKADFWMPELPPE
jgi:hypothetical protein